MHTINGDVWCEIIREVDRAESLHPNWPADVVHATAIVAEESGEAVRSALNHVYEGADIEEVKKEIVQTAATCIRLLSNM